jgi:hypothetical protein
MLINRQLLKIGTVFAEIKNHNSKTNECANLKRGDRMCFTNSVNYRYDSC